MECRRPARPRTYAPEFWRANNASSSICARDDMRADDQMTSVPPFVVAQFFPFPPERERTASPQPLTTRVRFVSGLGTSYPSRSWPLMRCPRIIPRRLFMASPAHVVGSGCHPADGDDAVSPVRGLPGLMGAGRKGQRCPRFCVPPRRRISAASYRHVADAKREPLGGCGRSSTAMTDEPTAGARPDLDPP